VVSSNQPHVLHGCPTISTRLCSSTGVRVDTPPRFARQLWPKGLHIKTTRGIADITSFRVSATKGSALVVKFVFATTYLLATLDDGFSYMSLTLTMPS
jgi:hypothetical protein